MRTFSCGVRAQEVYDVSGSMMSEPDHDSGVRTVSTRLGTTFEIHLWEDRTRGELWVPTYDQRRIALVSDEFLRTASGNAVDSGRRTFEFQAMAPGKLELVFEKRMGWKFTGEARRLFVIDVADGTGGSEGV